MSVVNRTLPPIPQKGRVKYGKQSWVDEVHHVDLNVSVHALVVHCARLNNIQHSSPPQKWPISSFLEVSGSGSRTLGLAGVVPKLLFLAPISVRVYGCTFLNWRHQNYNTQDLQPVLKRTSSPDYLLRHKTRQN